MSVICGHPVIAATRALRFDDHVTKRNGGSGDENGTKRIISVRRAREKKNPLVASVRHTWQLIRFRVF